MTVRCPFARVYFPEIYRADDTVQHLQDPNCASAEAIGPSIAWLRFGEKFMEKTVDDEPCSCSFVGDEIRAFPFRQRLRANGTPNGIAWILLRTKKIIILENTFSRFRASCLDFFHFSGIPYTSNLAPAVTNMAIRSVPRAYVCALGQRNDGAMPRVYTHGYGGRGMTGDEGWSGGRGLECGWNVVKTCARCVARRRWEHAAPVAIVQGNAKNEAKKKTYLYISVSAFVRYTFSCELWTTSVFCALYFPYRTFNNFVLRGTYTRLAASHSLYFRNDCKQYIVINNVYNALLHTVICNQCSDFYLTKTRISRPRRRLFPPSQI